MIEFPISGVETYWWLPAVVAFAIATFTGTGGVSGAFILMPFEISYLGYTTPSASPTNLLYNIIAIPSGVWRYHQERRMVWPLAWSTIIGTIPGVAIGAYVRLRYLPDPRSFKLFVGIVLLYLWVRLITDVVKKKGTAVSPAVTSQFNVVPICFNLREIGYEFNGAVHRAPTVPITLLGLIVGVVAGAYGIGGGAILSPLLVAVFQLPVHTVAGAALLGSFVTSVVGVLVYIVISLFVLPGGQVVMPGWYLGLTFGLGGALGMYVSARLQKHVSALFIKMILVVALLIIAGKYILGYFGVL
jgi:uncharacterized membrane protein YfcA